MNKILKALLQAKYPTVNIELLMDVVTATPNPEMATEILTGLYEEPVVKLQPSALFYGAESMVDIELISYNKWNNTVKFRYYSKKTKSVWKLKTADKPNYEDSTDVMEEYYFRDFAKLAGIDINDERLYHKVTLYGEASISSSISECDLDRWQ